VHNLYAYTVHSNMHVENNRVTVSIVFLLCFNCQMQLLTQIRLAMSFSSCEKRLQCVQARLQAISTLGKCRLNTAFHFYMNCLDWLFAANGA